MREQRTHFEGRRNGVYVLLLCAVGLLINILGVRIALRLKLPLFLDSIGCALAGALGGYVPGIIVGFFTNLINGINDYTTTYYGSLNALIAICAAYFARKGYFRQVAKLPLVIAAFALIGGGLGSVLTWLMYGFDFGTGISAPLARQIYAVGTMSQFWAQFSADMVIDVADKTVCVALVALVLRLLPEGVKRRFSADDGPSAKPVLVQRKSLHAKILLLITTAMLTIAVVVTWISYAHFQEDAISRKSAMASSALYVARDSIDAGRVNDYIEQGETAEGYTQAKEYLEQLMRSSVDIAYVYAYRVTEDGCIVVFDIDSDEMPGDPPGMRIPWPEEIEKRLPQFLAGEDIPPESTNNEYGRLLTVYEPVRDDEGVCQCYIAVDMNMKRAYVLGYQFLARIISLFFGFIVMVMTLVFWLAEYNVIWPVNAIARAVEQADFDSEQARGDALESVRRLNVRTGDEIENLYGAVVKTTEDLVRYVADVQAQSRRIGRLQSGLILVLADLVESRDTCTGDHVRKTAAYTGVIMRQLKRKGVYADQLTPAYMQNVQDSAPLHDLGKIQVPDAILNKPGRLTDEEFAVMKQHTTAGRDIIARAISLVSGADTGYLAEAMNLAYYHHEKWNGTGYPCGLKGEEIPLSARVMAVADVFDALVSKRSYKDGFPFEKAMAIIREGAGSHFDPEVAQAFLDAEDEVRAIMNAHMDG